MSVLVGDVIMGVRSLIPDMPGTLPPPVLGDYGINIVAVIGSTLPATNYYLRFSVLTPWGESTLSTQSAIKAIAGNQGLQITGTMPLGASALRAYFGPTNAQNQYVNITALPATISVPGTPGILPTINRAYLPDTDGPTFPAVTIYSWLRDALQQTAEKAGGIYDATGVNTTENLGMYRLPGYWKKMSHAWVDGWPFAMGNKGEIYYRNKVTTDGSGIVVCDLRGVTQIAEFYPVPDRTGGQTTLSGNVTAGATSLPCTSLGGFELDYGLALIGTEIVAYQVLDTGPALTGCLRGLGGTVAQAWPAGTAVSELNGRFAGYRYPVLPRVGDSNLNLDSPPTWNSVIELYVESRYREAERRFREAKELRSTFGEECKMLKSANQSFLGPRQTGETQTNEVYNAGLGGGWLLP